MPDSFDFYVVEQNSTGLFLVGFDAQTHQLTWGPDIDYSFWSTKNSKVSAFINQNNITGATASGKNGVHPSQRPPL